MSQVTAALLARLTEMDFVIALDMSGSMSETDTKIKGQSRYESAQETILAIARDLGKIDSDGLGLVLFNGGKTESFDGVDADKLKEIFASRSPRGDTPLDLGLIEALKLAGKSAKKDFIIVLTDGVPNDKQAAADVIVAQANKQENDDDLTFLFIQVGKDAAATAYLQKLDDDLTGAKHDIVDVKTLAEVDAFPSTPDMIYAAIEG